MDRAQTPMAYGWMQTEIRAQGVEQGLAGLRGRLQDREVCLPWPTAHWDSKGPWPNFGTGRPECAALGQTQALAELSTERAEGASGVLEALLT